MSPENLFVYGTLKRTIDASRPRTYGATESQWIRSLEFAGTGRTRGALFDLGGYPGLALGGSPLDGWVQGEIYRLPAAPSEWQSLLVRLDRYEECDDSFPRPWEYARRVIEVQSDSGAAVSCWAYVCNPDFPRPPDGPQRIDSGKW